VADDSEDEYDDWMEHNEEAILIASSLVSNIMYNNKYFCGILSDIV